MWFLVECYMCFDIQLVFIALFDVCSFINFVVQYARILFNVMLVKVVQFFDNLFFYINAFRT